MMSRVRYRLVGRDSQQEDQGPADDMPNVMRLQGLWWSDWRILNFHRGAQDFSFDHAADTIPGRLCLL